MVIFKNVLLLLFFTWKFTQGLEFYEGECMISSERDLGYSNPRCWGCNVIHKLQMNLTCSHIDPNFNIPDNNNERDVTVESVTFNSEVTTLPSAAFTNLPLFSNLYLQNLGLEEIFPGAFNAQHNLTQIYLDGNRLSKVSDGIFNSLMKLRILNLARNRIDLITPSAFVGSRLEDLYLNNNNISNLNPTLFNSQRFLKTLDLSFNNLKVVNLNALTIINMNLSNNQIEFLNVDKTNSIQMLDISKNKISTLKYMLSEHLEVLVAEYNSISQLDNHTFKDSIRLRELHLNNNNLSTISSSTFKNLHNLKYLNLSTNRLSSFVFGTFDGLQELTTLDISKNKFKILPYAFHSLNRLENFYFQYNEISDINMTEFLQQKPNLTQVRLDNNQWQCNKLMHLANQFKHHNVNIIKGNYSETSNIYGIQCQDHSHVDKDVIKNNMQFNTDSDNSILDKTGNKDFKVNLEILTDKLVKNQIQFLDKLTDRLARNQETFLSSLHSNSISDYKGRDRFSGEAFSAKYSSEKSSESNDAVFTLIVILLIVIIVTLIGSVYMIVFRKQNIDNVIKRDVELSQMLT